MEVVFDDEKVKALFTDFNLMIREKGSQITRAVKKRFDQLKAAETFADYLLAGLGKPHRLIGDKDLLYAVSITSNIRLIVKPITEDLRIESLKKCKKVIIKGAVDYHGKKTRIYIP